MPRFYFVDFDNTISTTDVGNAVQDRFSDPGWRVFNQRFLAGEIGSREALARQHRLMRCTREAFCEYARSFEIDPTFADFVQVLPKGGHDLAIVSDGVRTYIDILLEKYGLCGLRILSNDLRFEGDLVEYVFPYNREGCPHDPPCGNCKLLHVLACEAEEKIYIGDGYSDRRAVLAADRVYAKGSLLDFCRAEGIPVTPFKSFGQILKKEGLG